MTKEDLQLLEQAARNIIYVIERQTVHEENVGDRVRSFQLYVNDAPPAQQEELLNPIKTEQEEKGVFQITPKEIKKMSKTIKGKFFTQGFAVCWRKRPSGKNGYTYQVRFQRGEYNIQFHEKCKDNLKPRFLRELRRQTEEKDPNNTPTTFSAFAMLYFEKFRQAKVAERTYNIDMGRLKNHILPHFGDKKISAITPINCQALLDKLTKEGKGKTADEVLSLLNGIFNSAIKHHLIQYNPLDTVVHTPHEREKGVALTPEQENYFVHAIKGLADEVHFAVALYTGLRPAEYTSAKIDGKFIVAENKKGKTRKIRYKKIAISPMLRPYLEGIEQLEMPNERHLRRIFKKILPDNALYDLRRTFNTRCKECGVADPARRAFMGHSQGTKLDDIYTDLSNEYLLTEGEKIRY